jgi:AraC family transcriptional regulator of arabinose operon
MNRPTQTHDPEISSIELGHFVQHSDYQVDRVHGSASWLIILTLDGQGAFGYRGGEIRSAPGDICLLQPRVYHSYGIAEGAELWELRWAHFQARPHWAPFLDLPTVGPGLSRVHLEDEEFARVVERTAEATRLFWRRNATDELIAMAVLEEVLIRVHRGANLPGLRRDPRVEEAIEFATRRLADPIGLNDMARAVNLSPSRFGHLFLTEMGVSPCAFLERQRLARAAHLLQISTSTIQEISSQVGFENAFYFSNRFRRSFNMSPSEYRKRNSER